MIVALVTVRVAISSPVITYSYVFGTVNKTMEIEGALHCIMLNKYERIKRERGKQEVY